MYNTAPPKPKVPPLRQQQRNSTVMSDVSGGSVSTSVRPGSQDKARDLLPLSMVIPGDPIMNSSYVFIILCIYHPVYLSCPFSISIREQYMTDY